MRQWLYNLNSKMQRWMIGRYGMDEMNRTLLTVGMVVLLLSIIPPLRRVSFIAWILIIYCYFRCFSKNIVKRNQERLFYFRTVGKITPRLNIIKNRSRIYKKMWAERHTHKYFKCSKCKTFVRVPKGKGKIAVRCTKCNNEMIKKS